MDRKHLSVKNETKKEEEGREEEDKEMEDRPNIDIPRPRFNIDHLQWFPEVNKLIT